MAFYSNPKIVTDGLTLLLDAGSENSNPGSDIIHDLSGNDNDGTMYTGKCLDFDGITSNINITHDTSISPTTAITVMCWAHNSDWSSPSNERFVSKAEAGGYGLGPDIDGGNGFWYCYSNGSYNQVYYNMDSLSSGWHFFCGTFDGRYSKAYIDGIQVASTIDLGATYPIYYAVSNNLFIGCEAGGGTSPADRYYDGKISDAKIFNTALTSTQIAELYSLPNKVLPTGITASQLVGYWPLSEGDGTIAHDGSGNQNHGTLSGTTIPTWVNGETDIPQLGGKPFNKPMVFDGDADYVSIGDVADLDVTSAITVMSRFRVNEFDYDYQALVCKGDTTWRLHRHIGTNFIAFCLNGTSATNDLAGSIDVNDGQWHTAIGTYDGAIRKLYIDGVLDNSVAETGNIDVVAVNAEIGRNAHSTSRLWNGDINEVAVWDTAVDTDAITLLSASGSNGTPLPPDATTISGSNLVGYWRNDGDTTWEDRSGNGNNGTVNGTPDTIYLTEGKYKNRDSQGFNISDTSGWMAFDGSANYVTIPHNLILDNENTLTIECWINTSFDAGFPGEIGVIRKGSGGATGWSDAGWSIRLRDDIPAISFRKKDNTGYWDLYTGDKIIDGNWHHIVGTFDTTTLRKYVDGVQTQSTSTGQPYLTTTENLEIGRITAYLDGNISNVRLYSRVLSADEITQNFNAQRNRFGI
jgi:hypothetical protein